jgi:hypothetical protein
MPSPLSCQGRRDARCSHRRRLSEGPERGRERLHQVSQLLQKRVKTVLVNRRGRSPPALGGSRQRRRRGHRKLTKPPMKARSMPGRSAGSTRRRAWPWGQPASSRWKLPAGWGKLTLRHCKLTSWYCKLTLRLCRLTSRHCKLTLRLCRLTSWHCKLTLRLCKLTSWHCKLTSWHCKLALRHCRLTSRHCKLALRHCRLTSWHCKLAWRSGRAVFRVVRSLRVYGKSFWHRGIVLAGQACSRSPGRSGPKRAVRAA